MMTLIAAAIAAAPPSVPMQMPANAPAMHQQQAQQQMAEMKDDCCCKDMMEKMHSGHDMDGMQHHQEHHGD
jgi:hypothetical protein